MTEKEFKKRISQMTVEEANNVLGNKKEDLLKALAVVLKKYNKNTNIDDWECWVENILLSD